MPALFTAVTAALSGHDLLMMFGNQDLESIVSHYGWAVPHKCETCNGTGNDPNIYCVAMKAEPKATTEVYNRSICWDCHGLGYKIEPKYQ